LHEVDRAVFAACLLDLVANFKITCTYPTLGEVFMAFDGGALGVVCLLGDVEGVIGGGFYCFAGDIEVGDGFILVLVGLGDGVIAGVAGLFVKGEDWSADGEGCDGGEAQGGGDGGGGGEGCTTNVMY
jgi:hypothetical protein